MKTVQRSFVLAALAATVVALAAPLAEAQDLHPSRRPSPMAMARTMVGDAYVFVVYSRPYERGRDNIFGTEESEALVPYGQIWRTGANEATQLTTTHDLTVAGQALAAGTYSLFTTPGPDEWQVHFNSELGLSGPGRFDPEAGQFTPIDVAATNVLTVTVPAGSIPEEEKVDQLTISFEDAEGGGKHMVLRWITTAVRVPIATAG